MADETMQQQQPPTPAEQYASAMQPSAAQPPATTQPAQTPATTEPPNGHVVIPTYMVEQNLAIKRALPIHYEDIELEDEFAGWKARVRTNPRYSTIEALSDPLRVYDAFPQIVASWNFVDEEGVEIPLTPDGFKVMPVDLGLALIQKWNDVRRLPQTNAGS